MRHKMCVVFFSAISCLITQIMWYTLLGKKSISIIESNVAVISITLDPGKTLREGIDEYNAVLQHFRGQMLRKVMNSNISNKEVFSSFVDWNHKKNTIRERLGHNITYDPESLLRVTLRMPTNSSSDSFGEVCSNTEVIYMPTVIRSELDQHKWFADMNASSELNRTSCRKIFESVYTQHKLFKELAHVHVILGGLIDGTFGGVYHKNLYIFPSQCHDESGGQEISYNPKWSIYNEVFVTSQFWGEGYFHNTIENQPRIAILLPFLLMNDRVKIHVRHSPKTVEYLQLYGISSDRIVTGNVLSKIIYLPQGTLCGVAHALNLQVMSRMDNFGGTFSSNKTDTVILIRRHSRRYLVDHSKIQIMIERMAKQKNINFVTFSDKAIPSLVETRNLFRRAALVVGPHGAGLSNILFCAPGTQVVEILCKQEVNLCYQRVAFVLGHKYHGIVSRKNCPDLDVDLNYLELTLKHYIDSIGV